MDRGIFRIINLRLMFVIVTFRREYNQVAVLPEILDSSVITVDGDNCNISIIYGRLLSHNDKITIIDTTGVHAIAANAKSKIVLAVIKIIGTIALNVFFGI